MTNASQAHPPAGGRDHASRSTTLNALVLRVEAAADAAANAVQAGEDHEAALAELHASERALKRHLSGLPPEADSDAPPVVRLRPVSEPVEAEPDPVDEPEPVVEPEPAAEPVDPVEGPAVRAPEEVAAQAMQEREQAQRAARPPRRRSARFAARGGTSFITILCALAATVAAGVALVAAHEGNLRSDQGIIASVLTIALVVVALLQKPPGVRLRIERGVLHVETARGTTKFDLSDPAVSVVMDGSPGRRGWQVSFAGPKGEKFTVTAKNVDPLRFTRVIRRWRPEL